MHETTPAIDVIRSESRLGRAANLAVQVRSNSEIVIAWRGRDIRCGANGLAVLDAFRQPRSVKEALQLLSRNSSGVQDWQDLTSTILQLKAEGILHESGTVEPSLTQLPKGFDKPQIHIKMLNDRKRTEGLIAAIRETIIPGDIVLDIGTGTGVLAIAAALAGARHVYAIEAGAIGRVAREVVAANNLQERITIIEGWSTQIHLPELADLFVSEIIGNDPYAERVLEVTLDARRRLLKADARQVPRSIEIWGLPVSIPPAQINKNRFCTELQHDWLEWYGIDFGPLVECASGKSSHFLAKPHITRDWETFAPPVLLARTDLRNFRDTSIATTTAAVANRAGIVTGLVIFFRSQLSEHYELSTEPAESTAENSWRNRTEILPYQLAVQPGSRLSITYEFRDGACECGISLVP